MNAKIEQTFSWWANVNRGVEPEALLEGAKRLGYGGVELIGEEWWPEVKRQGLEIFAIAGHGSIESGLNDAANADRIEAELRANIQKADQWKISKLICFSGNRGSASDEEGLEICASTLARVASAAENAGVEVIVELLNSRVDHIGYQCDRTAWGVRLCEQVNSPAVKLLYDIYHMQIMEGDLVRTIQAHRNWFGHYHTAGNPGRGIPNETQEIGYPAVYRAIRATGYRGWIGHEFVPKGNPLEELEWTFKACEEAWGA